MNHCAILLLATSLSALAAKPALKTSVLEGNLECFRVSRVTATLAEEIGAAQNALVATNPVTGAILDLRFADGGDLAASRAAAGVLMARKLPLAVLVNGETRGEALALAASLRGDRAGLVFGSAPTAVKATGETLQPDIAVTIGLEAERAFLKNPYAVPGGNLTNLPAASTNSLLAFVDHTSEAELVSKRVKDGDEDGDLATPRAEPPQPVIRDPALARAVDWLKAVAVLNKTRG
jgi:hypothetical protein